MANRYLRANGNWNGPVWAETSGGTAGSAATPTANDAVFIEANYTVTLTADAECSSFLHTNGTLSFSSYKLSTRYGFESTGNTARTINMDDGTLKINNIDYYFIRFTLSGSNLTFNKGNSLLLVDLPRPSPAETQSFTTGSKEFNDVIINLGASSPDSVGLNITGNPTFRSLIIQSKNSAAHTVNFDGNPAVNKLVAIGSSSINKLKLTAPDGSYIDQSSSATSYGQFVDMNNLSSIDGMYGGIQYLGANSVATGTSGGWLLQDPPKISTLVDPLTTAPWSNPNWTVFGAITQVSSGEGGGGYDIAGRTWGPS